MKELETPKEVMQAFLDGHKLINSEYHDSTDEHYLYLSDAGLICEEDGAGAKAHRVPLLMRNGEWWRILK